MNNKILLGLPDDQKKNQNKEHNITYNNKHVPVHRN